MSERYERNLQYILDRCRVDDLTQCWEWTFAMTGDVPVCGQNIAGCSSAVKTAWLLSGRKIADGHVVWRALCHNRRCVNPAHMMTGSRPEMRRWCGQSGREKGDPVRAAKNIAALAARATPVEAVREAERMFARGEMSKTVVQSLGICKATATRIKAGRHIHSRGSGVKGSSIFSMVPA